MGIELIIGSISAIGAIVAIVVSILAICKFFFTPLIDRLENKFDKLNDEMKDIGKTLVRIEHSFGERLKHIERRVDKLEEKSSAIA